MLRLSLITLLKLLLNPKNKKLLKPNKLKPNLPLLLKKELLLLKEKVKIPFYFSVFHLFIQGERVFASPLARKTAESQNIDLSQVQGSGPSGRILKHNVEEFAAQGGAKQAAPTQAAPTQAAQTKAPKAATGGFVEAANPYEDIPLTNVREIIAKRLLQSKTTVPHYYLETEITMDEAIK